MPLQDRLDTKRARRDRAEKDHRQHSNKVEDLREVLVAERDVRSEIIEHKSELRAKIVAEEEADAAGKSERPELWTPRALARVDALADEVEHSSAVIEHVLDRIEKHADLRRDFAKEIEELSEDIARLAKRKEARKDRAGMVSKHFHIAEFHCRNGTPVPSGSVAAVERVAQLHLEKLRAVYGVITVNSGYRTRAYNASIGGATLSFHIYEEHPGVAAVDHTASGAGPHTVQAWYDAHTNPNGMGYYSAFTHIDNRSYRSRWYGS